MVKRAWVLNASFQSILADSEELQKIIGSILKTLKAKN